MIAMEVMETIKLHLKAFRLVKWLKRQLRKSPKKQVAKTSVSIDLPKGGRISYKETLSGVDVHRLGRGKVVAKPDRLERAARVSPKNHNRQVARGTCQLTGH